MCILLIVILISLDTVFTSIFFPTQLRENEIMYLLSENDKLIRKLNKEIFQIKLGIFENNS